METALTVIGAGGHAKVVVATARAVGRPIARILDDNAERWGSTLLGVGQTLLLGPRQPVEQVAVDYTYQRAGDAMGIPAHDQRRLDAGCGEQAITLLTERGAVEAADVRPALELPDVDLRPIADGPVGGKGSKDLCRADFRV